MVVAAAAVALHSVHDKFGQEFHTVNIVVETFFSRIVLLNSLVVKQKIFLTRFYFVSVKIDFEISATQLFSSFPGVLKFSVVGASW